MVHLPLDASGRRTAFFDEEGVDQLLSMVLELATELWVVRERLFVLEAAAGLEGVVERFEPTPAQEAQLAALRRALTENLFRTLGRDHRRAG